jgi:acyl carrier protein
MRVEERVLNVFRDVLELDSAIETKGLKYNEVSTWRSLAHITLVSALEGEFDIMLDPDDILAMSSYDKAVEIVRKYCNAN